MRPVFAWFEPCSAKQQITIPKVRDMSRNGLLRVRLLKPSGCPRRRTLVELYLEVASKPDAMPSCSCSGRRGLRSACSRVG